MARCNLCAARHVKCDSESGECGNCVRLGQQCVRGASRRIVENTSNLQEVTRAGIKRTRTQMSCDKCRKSKRKCDGQLPCDRCARIDPLDCTYSPKRVHRSESVAAIPPENSNETGESDRSFGNIKLFAQSLGCRMFPGPELLRTLIDRFFQRIAVNRILGFLHEPTFIQKLGESFASKDVDELMLLLAICATASKLNHAEEKELWNNGTMWAEDVSRLLMSSLNIISVNKLAAVILLHEHEYRSGNSSACFILGSILARYTQILQLNVEYDSDILCESPGGQLSVTDKEMRRRLMWCCFFVDIMTATGVGQLRLLDQRNIKIQLPSSDELFAFQKPCITGSLSEQIPIDAADEQGAHFSASNIDYRAYLVQIAVLRYEVLSYVKRFNKDNNQWESTSEFSKLLMSLKQWKAKLPGDLELNQTTVYIRKAQSKLGPLLWLHILYHLCFCDIYRIIMPGLSFAMRPEVDAIQLTAPAEFLEGSQDACFYHACEISKVLDIAIANKNYHTFDDTSVVIGAHEASRVQITYLQVASLRLEQAAKTKIMQYLETNLRYLDIMVLRFPVTKMCFVRTAQLMEKAGYAVSSIGGNLDSETPRIHDTPMGELEENLHPLSQFREVRSQIAERHGAENLETRTLSSGTTLDGTEEDFEQAMFSFGLESWLLRTQFGELT